MQSVSAQISFTSYNNLWIAIFEPVQVTLLEILVSVNYLITYSKMYFL